MLTNIIARSSEEVQSLSLGTRARRYLLLGLCVAGFFVGMAYHVIVWSSRSAPDPFVEALYHGVVLVAFLFLWTLLSHVFKRRPSTPARSFWTVLVSGVLFIGIARLVLSVGSPPVPTLDTQALGFDLELGIPLTLATVFKMNVLSLLEAGFAFILLLRLRDLVLFKRTRGSQRNWYLMLTFMAVAALFTLGKSPRADIGVHGIAMIPAVVLMVMNSFRLSWIVYLPFREKMASIGLTLLLLGLLLAGFVLEETGLLPVAGTYIRFYSYPLSTFTLLAVFFGILYCTTAFLSLLFHLPTTGDFQQKVGEMAAMHSLTALVSQVFDSEQLVHSIAASPVDAGLAQMSWLAMTDLQSGSLRPRIVATHHIAPSRIPELVDTDAFFEELCSRREPVLLDQAPADHRVSARPGDGLGSLLAVPLLARETVLGALFVTKEVSHGFEKDDIEAIRVFGAQAALALDHARLFEEQIEKERMARELAIAHEVQRKLLPQRIPELPGASIAASNVSATEVGGDYYDFVELEDNRLAVIIADVSGKGTPAAFYMAEMQGIFQAVSRLTPSPADFLSNANVALSRALEKHVFVSVIYGVLDARKEEFVLARAGHCPAALINLNGDARLLRTQGLGLGLDRGDLFRRSIVEERIRLQPGDVCVLYTDGVIETRNARGEEYGYDRLLTSLREHRHEDAGDLHDALLGDLQQFTGHQAYDDDMTLVVIKWHGIELRKRLSGNDVHRERTPASALDPRAIPMATPEH
jgi:phosphoserine phosphatase RsbU/P